MSQALALGSRLGRYQLVSELGRGGMASVWVAREYSQKTGKQRLVAVKAMLPKLAQSSDFRSMFLDEGQLVRSIDHPSVVRVHDVGEAQGILYLAMDWIEGDSLYAIIKAAKQRRAIPPEQAVRIIADTAAGLHVAHELRGWDGELRGVVHCDVSPQNILVGLDGQTKLVDFGVAHAATRSASDSDHDRIAGKAGYMSPEQVLGGELDRRSDLFSLGIVLFELTTGRRLFRGRDRSHSMHLVHVAEIPRPTSLFPDYPKPLEEIVLKALQRDRDQRFQTAEEFARALERFLVDSRIMVARSSVGQLLKRVLGERIQQRREQIRAALKSLKEGRAAGVAVGPSPMPGAEVSLPSLSLNGVEPPASASTTGVGSMVSSRGRSTGTPRPAVSEIPPRSPTAPLRIVVPAALLVTCGLGAYWWGQKRPVSVTRISVTAAAAEPSRPEADSTSRPERSADNASSDHEATAADAGAQTGGPSQPKTSPATPPGEPAPTAVDRLAPEQPTPSGEGRAALRGGVSPEEVENPYIVDEPKPKTPGKPGLAPKPPGAAKPPSPRPKKKADEPDFSNPYR